MPNPRQLRHFIDCYKQLSADSSALEKIAEFITRYRFFTMGLPANDTLAKLYYYDLYREYIQPLLVGLEQQGRKSTRTKIENIQKMANAMIASTDHNDTWAVALVIAVYQKSSSWPSYRPLSEEPSIHSIKQINLDTEKSLIDEKEIQKQVDGWVWEYAKRPIRMLNREIYLADHMPKKLNQYRASQKKIYLLTIILALSIAGIFFYSERSYAGIATICLTPFLIYCGEYLVLSVNYKLRSHLDFHELPQALKAGLLTELHTHINECIEHYRRQLPILYKKKNSADSKIVPGFSMLPTSPRPEIAVVDVDRNFSAAVPDLTSEKKKTRSWQPSLCYELPVKPKVYSWKTKEYGEIKFQLGHVTETLFPLWTASKKFDERYVVLFPREALEAKAQERMITNFWKTARFGRIAHDENQAGYIFITDQEKENKSYKLSRHSIFKIKTPPHSEYSAYRQPVSPCPVIESDADQLELLEAGLPVKTH